MPHGVDLGDRARHQVGVVGRHHPVLGVHQRGRAARAVQQRQQAPLQPLHDDVRPHHPEELPPGGQQRHRERERVLGGAQRVDVRAGDVAGPGVAGDREPRQLGVVPEVVGLGVELGLQPLHGRVATRAAVPPLHPVPHARHHPGRDDQPGADQRGARRLQHRAHDVGDGRDRLRPGRREQLRGHPAQPLHRGERALAQPRHALGQRQHLGVRLGGHHSASSSSASTVRCTALALASAA